ncbi:hypothetical protein PVAP13_6NG271532 [Panicum virgatum]|uniref:Uncharacterized protein n=1 Tax=Panicum virgatum TaxID=38727 RepID=A0A8T0R1Q8_PANVG|nr:hypothetical protein PVAP13_6NG271532 [Panicum virgatum]
MVDAISATIVTTIAHRRPSPLGLYQLLLSPIQHHTSSLIPPCHGAMFSLTSCRCSVDLGVDLALVNPRMGLNNTDLNADMMPTDLGVDRCDGGKIRNLMLSFANRGPMLVSISIVLKIVISSSLKISLIQKMKTKVMLLMGLIILMMVITKVLNELLIRKFLRILQRSKF